MDVPVCTHACGGQRSRSGGFLNCFPSYFSTQGLSLDMELNNLARPPGQ